MSLSRSHLELLAPAKNADFGIEAIRHGADAVYIGGPAFGARSEADNSVADIERLANFAHRFGARVFVALNTILTNAELDQSEGLVRQIHAAGADALIVQDMGLLELDLPPIQLHASTQTDIRDLAKARFLDQVGFSQIVLAREMSMDTVQTIAAATSCKLEYFVHGALCVAFSGQCYISHAHTGRSANRGECSQACRLPYDLVDQDAQVLAQGRHLLSMKDNNQSANLLALAEAGVSSFKIEGRLKDLAYVKNITAHYRQLLDEILDAHPQWVRASAGRSSYTFAPLPEKTFNRGYTDYFANGRHGDIGAFDSPKFVGEPIGSVRKVDPQGKWCETETVAPLHNGDGLSFYDAKGELQGLRVSRVEGARVFPNERLPKGLVAGTPLFRNHDQEFARALERPSAERRIAVDMAFSRSEAGYRLDLTDETGLSAAAEIEQAYEPARDPERALADLRDKLAQLGTTDFVARTLDIALEQPGFLPASQLKALRRDAVAALEAARAAAFQTLPQRAAVEPPAPYPEDELSYLANIFNDKARAFYARHGVKVMDAAFEANEERDEVSLMITKHCLRYSFNLCPREVKGVRPDPMTLVNGKETLTLRFDCKRCEMHVLGKLRKSVIQAQTVTFHPKGTRPPQLASH